MKRVSIFGTVLPAFAFMLAFSVSGFSYAASSPTDISRHWAKNEITSAASEGWAYTEKGKFSPDKKATREEVVWGHRGTLKVCHFQ